MIGGPLHLAPYFKRKGMNQKSENMWSFQMTPSNLRNVIFMSAKYFHVKMALPTKVLFLGLPVYSIVEDSYNVPLGAIEKFWDFMNSCSLFWLLLTFFGGYGLYIIAIISPLEPERAAEARSAVVASFILIVILIVSCTCMSSKRFYQV